MAGLSQLLEDLRRLSEDRDSADVIFLIGKNEEPVYAHRLLLKCRLKSFQLRKNEICKIPGSTVSSTQHLTTIRLPQMNAEIFQQFISYVYSAKILLQDSKIFEMMVVAHDMGMDELKQICEVIQTDDFTYLDFHFFY